MMRLFNVRVLSAAGLGEPNTMELPVADGDDRDASGLILSPGWVDLHAHLRDPGFPEKETLFTGSASAAFGGFTRVVAMANTDPVTDSADRLAALEARATQLPVRVSFAAAFTVNLDGKQLTDAAALRAAGAVALSDDGRHAMDAETLRRGLQAAEQVNLPVFIHAQKEDLGRAPEAESRAIAEAIEALQQVPGARLHIQHVSTRGAVDRLRDAKRAGLAVTAEATPHHLTLTLEDAIRMGPFGNVAPPLRSTADRDAVLAGLEEGVIDAIATDHAPHEVAAKAAGANGFHGFETAVGVVMALGLDPAVIYRACVQRPSEILALPPPPPSPQGGGSGSGTDWILIDPDAEWSVDPASFRSRGKNTPFAGRRLKARVVMTVCDGQILFERMLQRV